MAKYEVTVFGTSISSTETFTLDADEFDLERQFSEFLLDGEVVYSVKADSLKSVKLLTPTDPQPETDIRKVLDALVETVSEFGKDFVYQKVNGVGCVYVYNGAPHCLAGKVLRKLGVSLETLARREKTSCNTFANYVDLDQRALDVLRIAQEVQDMGGKWGLALEKAVSYARSSYNIEYVIPAHLTNPTFEEVTEPPL